MGRGELCGLINTQDAMRSWTRCDMLGVRWVEKRRESVLTAVVCTRAQARSWKFAFLRSVYYSRLVNSKHDLNNISCFFSLRMISLGFSYPLTSRPFAFHCNVKSKHNISYTSPHFPFAPISQFSSGMFVWKEHSSHVQTIQSGLVSLVTAITA